ncbi:hypothetical protein [Actinocrispum sp. NPDC049592]|uniref:hypothetical protein n=1 Tax=Actinocrispum sp. NPDC049592 TaxID=3154835 RepID=UPI0034265975
MTENSSAGLFMLAPEVSVTVTREEHHQQAFARYPVREGMSRRVAVELTWCTIASGKYRGERAIEVRLDGYRVGELTYAMTQRYAPMLAQVTDSGRLPGCTGLIHPGQRGTEIDLLLPRPTSAIAIPGPRSGAFAVAPQVAVPAAAPARENAPRKGVFARNKPAWIGGGVVGVLLIAAIAGQSSDTPVADGNPSLVVTSSSTTTTTTTTTFSTQAPAAPLFSSSSTAASPPQAPPAQVQPQTQTQAPATKAKPQTTTSKAAPPPKPPAPPAAPTGGCDPNYTPCVPIASDVDCAGGSGNGPAYVKGPVRVVGRDIYDLDRDGNGIGCE